MICLYDKLINRGKFKEEYIDVMNEEDICIYKSVYKKFVNLNGDIIDVSNQEILPVSGIDQVREICDEVLKQGGILIVNKDDNLKVENWNNYYKTIRKINAFKGSDLLNKDVVAKIREVYGEKFFFKTLKKNYSATVLVDYLHNEESVLCKSLEEHLDEVFLISELIEVMEDETGKMEYRAVVVDGVLRNISRITDSIYHNIPSDVVVKALEIVENINKVDFPKSYVVDLMKYKRYGIEEIDVVEFNSICSSGFYLYNSIVDLEYNDLEHDDIKRIPLNKEYLRNDLLSDGKIDLKPSKYFSMAGSFAESVKKMTGEIIGVFVRGFNNNKRYEADECLGDKASLKSFNDLFADFNIIEVNDENGLKKELKK